MENVPYSRISQAVIIHGKYLGELIRMSHYQEWWHGWVPSPDVVYVCPVCGEVWARFGRAGGCERGYQIERAHCDRHGEIDGSTVPPGSLLRPGLWAANLLTQLPATAIARELTLHLNFYKD